MLISLRCSTYVMGSNVNLGSFEVTEATVSRSVSRSSFFFFFFFWQHFKVLYLRHDLTDFDQTWSQVPVDHGPFMSHDQIRVKGHVGVTGVKKVIFTKNATPPTDYRVWSCDSCTCISLTPSTKVMGLKIHPGSFGVTGVKRSFSLKMQ